MRCLTLAEAFKKNGASVLFIFRYYPGNLNHLIINKDFQVIGLPQPDFSGSRVNKEASNGDDYRAWLGFSEKQDANDTIRAIGDDKPDWLILDHYAIGEQWEKMLRPHVKNIMVIDDLANRRHDCDLLLDQNWFENRETRYDDLVSAGCTKLLGPEYALLRSEFADARKKVKLRTGEVQRIFVFFGSVDSKNMTAKTLRALSGPELTHLAVDVVIGENNPNRNEIHELAVTRDNFYLHIQVDDIAGIMAKADLAIGSGGVNTWERMCLGLPSLTISIADNHHLLLKDLAKNGYVTHLGRGTDVDETRIKSKFLEKTADNSSVFNQSKRTVDLVKGDGSKLVVEWLTGSLIDKKWKVKSATAQNMELYWDWVNDEEVRNNAINKKLIPWEDHVTWFNEKLDDEKCSFYLILVDNYPIGQVRFEDEGNFSRIDYSIARQFRERKLGKMLLNKAIKEYQKHNNTTILGEVIPDNFSSAKIFESLGFSMKINRDNIIYTKELGVLTKVNE